MPFTLLRGCSKPTCRRWRREGGRYCRPCAAQATREWRERKGDELRAIESGRVFTPEQKAIRDARKYLAVYLSRGKVERGLCEVCREEDVIPAWDDPRQPLVVRWFCSADYGEWKRERAERSEMMVTVRAEYADLAAAVAALPPADRQRLHEEACLGPSGNGCKPGGNFYWWTLREAHRRYVEERLAPLV